MKCSDCSKVVRPIVAIDIDGTIGDYHDHFYHFAELYLGGITNVAAHRYDGAASHREFWEGLGVDARTFRDMKLAYRQGGMKRSMPKMPGASGLMSALRLTGAEIWLTTTRPYMRLDGVDPDTREWLRRNGIEYDGLLYDKDKYTLLAERVDPDRVVAVLDDLPEQICSAAAEFGSAIPVWMRGHANSQSRLPGHLDGFIAEAETRSQASHVICGRVGQWFQTHNN